MEREITIRTSKMAKQKPLSDKAIINVLLAMIKHHETIPDKIAMILEADGIKISEYNIRWVIQQFDIKKKVSPSRS